MRIFLITLLIAMAGMALGDQLEGQEAEVTAPIGRIRGKFMQSRLGRQFFAARGVRYGEAPIGEHRFKQAVPAKPWTTVFDATEEGPACPQPAAILPSEDCLRLNVYTPKLPSAQNSDAKKPVLVFFHAGGFYVGSAQSNLYGPEYLMDQDIVLVTVNYRLMSLGFISTGDAEAPGNLGLKDQVEALRWVKRNIESFGGDSGNVVIAGYSAGAWSVSLHLVSPMTKGLFHRAIAMSGSATYQKPLGRHQKDLAERQARLLGCPTNTSRAIMACLKTKSMQEFVDSFEKMFDWRYNPVLLWNPVVEPKVPGVERYLTDEPVKLILQGKFHQVPLITGITKDEFGGNVVNWVETERKGNVSLFTELNDNWETLAPIIFQYERITPRSKEISRDFKSFYFRDQPVSLKTVDGVAQLYADGLIVFSVHRLAKLIAAVSTQPVYYYEFTYQGRYSHHVWSDTKKPYGVVHHDDLLYLFNVKRYFPYFNTNDPEYSMVRRLTSMWTSFAKCGNPIPRDVEGFENVTWDAFTPENKKYMNIGDNLTMATDLYAVRMNEWEKLFPLPSVDTPGTNVKH
ncbi:esterase E4 isoform X1 [Neodiprion pinetum]|uniref:Carboxylic ester hydrolase n=1 Tax=Neodiprion lecontei TaxID=441921 RepID=A0A6J0BNC1_NEOLC|nr:esterase E4 isoform X1 [Neodiprion lecontei]XP_046479905.1 esterase E4-like isoform X1 [Neodiprion pinetum]